MRDGRMANAQLTNYIIPTTLDTPPMDVVIVEKPYAHGPYGAKGVGEMPFDGAAPAVVNAIRSLGLDIREVPGDAGAGDGRALRRSGRARLGGATPEPGTRGRRRRGRDRPRMTGARRSPKATVSPLTEASR